MYETSLHAGCLKAIGGRREDVSGYFEGIIIMSVKVGRFKSFNFFWFRLSFDG
jgi:hypothetical protein